VNIRFSMLTVAGAGVLAFAGVSSGSNPRGDHLSPLERLDERTTKYQEFLTTKLGITPFNCGRVVDQPSFGSESVVSVYSQTQNGRLVSYVSCVQAAENLWQRSKSMHDVANAQAVGIKRVDAEIPSAVAEHIKQVWMRMLRDRRPWKRPRLEFELGGYLRFSIQQLHGPALEAELWLPPPGPKTQALVKISDALWEYCKATPAARPAIASKIDREATALLALLK